MLNVDLDLIGVASDPEAGPLDGDPEIPGEDLHPVRRGLRDNIEDHRPPVEDDAQPVILPDRPLAPRLDPEGSLPGNLDRLPLRGSMELPDTGGGQRQGRCGGDRYDRGSRGPGARPEQSSGSGGNDGQRPAREARGTRNRDAGGLSAGEALEEPGLDGR
jgi:hypothetical protein